MLSLNRLEELGVAYDWRTSSLIWTKSEWILASIIPWNGINAVELNLEAVSRLRGYQEETQRQEVALKDHQEKTRQQQVASERQTRRQAVASEEETW